MHAGRETTASCRQLAPHRVTGRRLSPSERGGVADMLWLRLRARSGRWTGVRGNIWSPRDYAKAVARRTLTTQKKGDAGRSLYAIEHYKLFSRFRFGEFLFELVDPVLQRR